MRLHGVDVYSHDLSLFIIGFYTGPNLLPYEFEVKCTAENSTCLADSEGELVSGVLPDALSYVTATVTGLDSDTTFWCYVLSVIKSGRVCQGPFVGKTELPYVTWSYVGSPGFSAGRAAYTSLALDSSDTPYVAFQEEGYASNVSKATVMTFDGSNWVNVGSPGFSAGVEYYTSLALDSSDTPYVAYEDGGFADKATVMAYQ
jgi:hypothetical protein